VLFWAKALRRLEFEASSAGAMVGANSFVGSRHFDALSLKHRDRGRPDECPRYGNVSVWWARSTFRLMKRSHGREVGDGVYYPFFRGKQYELFWAKALRRLATSSLSQPPSGESYPEYRETPNGGLGSEGARTLVAHDQRDGSWHGQLRLQGLLDRKLFHRSSPAFAPFP